MSDRSTRLLALLALAGFVAAFILVHFVRDDLSVWHTTLSIFAVGPAGWVLTLGFYAIALTEGLIAYRDFAWRRSTSESVMAGVLLLAAVGTVLVAVFPHNVKLPHNIGAALQLGLVPMSLLLRAFWIRQPHLRIFNGVMAVLCTACFVLLLLNDLLRDYAYYSFGFFQKTEILCITVWLIGYSWYLPAQGLRLRLRNQ